MYVYDNMYAYIIYVIYKLIGYFVVVYAYIVFNICIYRLIEGIFLFVIWFNVVHATSLIKRVS